MAITPNHGVGIGVRANRRNLRRLDVSVVIGRDRLEHAVADQAGYYINRGGG